MFLRQALGEKHIGLQCCMPCRARLEGQVHDVESLLLLVLVESLLRPSLGA
jgi:hypothetical protein